MCRVTQLESKNPSDTIVFHTFFDSLINRGSQEMWDMFEKMRGK